MSALQETLQLEPGEDLIAVYRRHGGTAFIRILPLALFCIALFLFLFPLFSLGARGVAIFFILAFFTLLFSVRIIASWLGTITIVTSRRLLIVLRYGFFKKSVTEIQYDQISQMSYQVRGIMQMLGRYGNLELLVTFTSANITIPDMPDPQGVLNKISQVMNNAKKSVAGGLDDGAHLHGPAQPRFHAKKRTEFSLVQPERNDPANWR